MKKFVPCSLDSITGYGNKRGYLTAYCRNRHPYCAADGSMLFHRLVMENHLGRYLLPTELVHHKDGNKRNNSINNLEVVSVEEHAKLHRAKPVQRICKYCGSKFAVSQRTKAHRYSRAVYCSPVCRKASKSAAISEKNKLKAESGKDTHKSGVCSVCSAPVASSRHKFCSQACAHVAQRRAARPSAKELMEMVNTMPTEQVGLLFGVTGNTIAKWCKAAGVQKPSRGHWGKVQAGKK